jgi:Ca2+-binding RTX toxin-like protein
MATINGDQNPNNLNDFLSGTEGNDTIKGGKGDDLLFIRPVGK